ncbi:MerR family transcriptional regulator [Marinobacter sp. M1N3S26]|uniref:MerR family transcriptional regulator n=1 Tax=unclassified Marinobacter TaxID=83889 RepID=UPI00387B4147
MKIGALAQQTGVSVRMLRYYEAEGLLTPARTSSGYRDYGSADRDTVERIKMLGASGMTLPVIQQFLPCALDTRGEFEPCDELTDILDQQMELVADRIQHLRESHALLCELRAKVDTRARNY